MQHYLSVPIAQPLRPQPLGELKETIVNNLISGSLRAALEGAGLGGPASSPS